MSEEKPAHHVTAVALYHPDTRTVQLNAIVDGIQYCGAHTPLNEFVSALELPLPPYEGWSDVQKKESA